MSPVRRPARPAGRRPGNRARRRAHSGRWRGPILIKTERMRGVEIDGEPRRGSRPGVLCGGARRGRPGATASALLPGSSPNVGGGRLHARRRPELAGPRATALPATGCSAIELVDRRRRARARWMPRTSPTCSGPFAAGAAATRSSPRCTLGLLPLAEAYAGALLLPAEVGARGRSRLPGLGGEPPDEVTSIVPLPRPPPVPDVPEPLRDRPLLTIGATCIGTQEQGEAMIAPLREIGEPIMDTFAQMPRCRARRDPHGPRRRRSRASGTAG